MMFHSTKNKGCPWNRDPFLGHPLIVSRCTCCPNLVHIRVLPGVIYYTVGYKVQYVSKNGMYMTDVRPLIPMNPERLGQYNQVHGQPEAREIICLASEGFYYLGRMCYWFPDYRLVTKLKQPNFEPHMKLLMQWKAKNEINRQRTTL